MRRIIIFFIYAYFLSPIIMKAQEQVKNKNSFTTHFGYDAITNTNMNEKFSGVFYELVYKRNFASNFNLNAGISSSKGYRIDPLADYLIKSDMNNIFLGIGSSINILDKHEIGIDLKSMLGFFIVEYTIENTQNPRRRERINNASSYIGYGAQLSYQYYFRHNLSLNLSYHFNLLNDVYKTDEAFLPHGFFNANQFIFSRIALGTSLKF